MPVQMTVLELGSAYPFQTKCMFMLGFSSRACMVYGNSMEGDDTKSDIRLPILFNPSKVL